MNKQEIFDKALNGIIGQGGPCFDGGCRLVSGERRCAIGWNLESYSPDMEQVDPACYLLNAAKGEEVLFLQHLQGAHDDNANLPSGMTERQWISGFLMGMQKIADNYKLKFDFHAEFEKGAAK